MTDLRQAAQQALEALEGWDNYGAWVWPESALEQSKQNTTDSIAALRKALAQPEQQAEPCIGKDPRCPCQDGDACHYKDCGNTKAWPVPQAEPTPWRDMVVVTLVREGIDKHKARELADHFAAQPEPTCPECKAAVLYECVACSSNNYPPKPKQEPVAWEHHEYRPYGGPGQIRIHAVLASQYMMPDGSVHGDFQWLVDEYKKDKNTIKLIPLYTTPPAAQWDKPSASFNEWWDSNVMPPANPFAEGSAAFWAWAGWKAAQRPWVGLTDEEKKHIATAAGCTEDDDGHIVTEIFRLAEAKLKERNT